MITALALCAAALAGDPLVDALQIELDRSMKELKLEEAERPFRGLLTMSQAYSFP